MNDPLLRTPGIPPGDRSSRNKRKSNKRRNSKRKSSKSAPDVLTPSKGSTAAHVGNLRSQWANALKTMPSYQRTKLYVVFERGVREHHFIIITQITKKIT